MTALAPATAGRAAVTDAIAGRRRGRVTAVLTVSCAVGHVPLLLAHASMAPLLCVVMAVVALACLGCLRRLGLGPTRGTWSKVLGLSATMVLLHVPMLLSGHLQHASAPALHLSGHVGRVGLGATTVSGYSAAAGETIIAATGAVALGLALVQVAVALSVLVPWHRSAPKGVNIRRGQGSGQLLHSPRS